MRSTTPLRPLPRRWPMLSVLLALFLTALATRAQTAAPGDPPDRVARLSYVSGDVGFLPSGASAWSEASLNRPLTRGDRLSATDDARAELELDGGTLRIGSDTDFGFLQLDNQLAQIELTRGTLAVSIRTIGQGQSYEIDTPTVALVLDQPGVFRIDVNDTGGTRITALEGQATVYGDGGAQRSVIGGHRYRFDDSTLARVEQDYIGPGDAFDHWCAERDRRYADSQSRQYVSEDVIGYQDLDRYGTWQRNATYGEVWYPSQVNAGWAPYRFGHWAYVAPWGWTWVDDSPWGFAPYHYGRWISVGGHWGWIPGPRGLRPIYAPALVAFVGGRGWSVSVGYREAPIGWFPLGPGDIYNPWYRASHRYYREVNEHNLHRHRRGHDRDREIARIDRHYRHFRDGHPEAGGRYLNRKRAHGLTAVSRDTFVHARRVEHDRLRVDPDRLRRAPVLVSGNHLPPVRASLAPARSGRARALPVNGFRGTVVARRAPPANDRNPAGIAVRSERAKPTPRVRVLGQSHGNAGTAETRPTGRTTATAEALRQRFPQAAEARPAALPSSRFPHAPRQLNSESPRSRGFAGSNLRDPRVPAETPARQLPVVPRIVRGDAVNRRASGEQVRRFGQRTTQPARRPATLPTPARIEAIGGNRPAARGYSTRPATRSMPTAVAARPAQPIQRPEPRAMNLRAEPRFERPRMVQTPRPPPPVQPRRAPPPRSTPTPAARPAPAPARSTPAAKRQPPARGKAHQRLERQ